MLKYLTKKDSKLKEILCILCNHKNIRCKEGNINSLLKFVKNKKIKAIILLMGGISEKEAKKYAFLVSEVSKAKKVVYALDKNYKFKLKILIAY